MTGVGPIEDNIPLVSRRGRFVTELGKRVRALKVGQSIAIETEALVQRARDIARYIGIRVEAHKDEKGNGWRVWRVA